MSPVLRRVLGLLSKWTVNREQDLKRCLPFWLSLLIINKWFYFLVLPMVDTNKSFSDKVEKPPKDSNEGNSWTERSRMGQGACSRIGVRPHEALGCGSWQVKQKARTWGQLWVWNPCRTSVTIQLLAAPLGIPRMGAESQGQLPSVFRPEPLLLAVSA